MDELLRRIRDEGAALTQTLTFGEYLREIARHPERSFLAHMRIHRAITGEGPGGTDAPPGPEAFAEHCFGMEAVIAQVADYFGSAARRLDTRRRILLLVGPPGSGKSTLVGAIKRALERQSRMEGGAVYAIQGCPLQEDPLHLIPRRHRAELPVYVEGDLCPHCRWLVREVYRGELASVPIERFAFSEAAGTGIGTFVATDPGSEDLRRLTGSVDPVPAEETDALRARRFFRLDGALEQGNRGLVDLVDVFKMDERFLDVLLTASQEQRLQTAGPGLLYVDAALVAESNLADYEALVANRKTAALQDRLVVARVPYVLRVHDEVRIYQRMLAEADLAGRHLSPLALRAAATLAILTRLGSPGRMEQGLLKRLRAYEGAVSAEWDPEAADRLRHEQPDDGFSGLSPRYVMTQISNALAGGTPCVTASLVLERLWAGLAQRTDFRPEQAGRWSNLFQMAGAALEDMVRSAFQQGMVADFHEQVRLLAQRLRAQLKDGPSNTPERFSLEEAEHAVHLPAYRREAFRAALSAELQRAGDLDHPSAYRRYPVLRSVAERLLLPGWPAAAALLAGERTGGQPMRGSVHEVRGRLIAQGGYCAACADEVVNQATLIARHRAARQRWTPLGWRRG